MAVRTITEIRDRADRLSRWRFFLDGLEVQVVIAEAAESEGSAYVLNWGPTDVPVRLRRPGDTDVAVPWIELVSYQTLPPRWAERVMKRRKK